MQNKINFDNITEYIHLFMLSVIFGVASFLFKVREGKAIFNGFNAFSEISFSLISAYMAFRICSYFNTSEDLMWVFTGIAAWSGTRFLIKLEGILERHLESKFNSITTDPVNKELSKEEE